MTRIVKQPVSAWRDWNGSRKRIDEYMPIKVNGLGDCVVSRENRGGIGRRNRYSYEVTHRFTGRLVVGGCLTIRKAIERAQAAGADPEMRRKARKTIRVYGNVMRLPKL